MTQITISQWLLNQQYPKEGGKLMPVNTYPFATIVASKKFYGHYDVLTVEGERIPCANIQTARATCLDLNTKNKDWK